MLSRAFKDHQTNQAAHREKQGIYHLCCKLKLLLLTQWALFSLNVPGDIDCLGETKLTVSLGASFLQNEA